MSELKAVYFTANDIPVQALLQIRKTVYGESAGDTSINYKYLLTCVVIWKQDLPAGTLCLYKNNKLENGQALLIGNLECIDDKTVFERLMQELKAYAVHHRFNHIVGPINGSTWDEYRLPLDHFGVQFITDLPQPAYYTNYLQQAGFTIYHQYFTQQSFIEKKETDTALVQQMKQAGIIIRSISLNSYEEELIKLHAFCSKMFAHNVLYSPIEKADFVKKYIAVKPLIQPDFVLIAEDIDKNIQGFIFSFPELYQKHRLVIKTIARNIENTNMQGLMTYMINILHNNAFEHGFKYLLHAFMHSNNRSKLLSEKYGGQVVKTYALFTTKIED